MTDAQRRLLQAVFEHVSVDRIAEVHLFPPMRHGVMETGIAVVAVEGEVPVAVAAEAETELDGDRCDPTDAAAGSPPQRGERHIVITARYRQTLKGPDRGRWETSVVEEADAPLVTVEAVVRGVQKRANEDGEVADAERMSTDDLRAMIESPAWPPPPPPSPGTTKKRA